MFSTSLASSILAFSTLLSKISYPLNPVNSPVVLNTEVPKTTLTL